MAVKDKLLVIWSTADREVALHNTFMYTLNAKVQGWWPEVRLLIWGPSSELLTVDIDLQREVAAMLEAGVDVIACIACADRYGVTEDLRAMGITVLGAGPPLTEMLKDESWAVLTY